MSRLGEASVDRDPFDMSWYAYVDAKTYGPYSGHTIRSMVARGEIVGSDLVVASGNSNWVQAKDDPVLRLLFVNPDHEATEQPPSRYTARHGRRINRIAIALVLAAIGWIIWPYYAVYDLAKGLKAGDVIVLQKRVNWENVRTSLRGDANALLLKSSGNDQSDLGRGFALALGPALINQMIDGFVTPQAFAHLMKDGKTSDDPSKTGSLPSGGEFQQAINRISPRQVEYAFFSGSPLSFRITMHPPNPEASGLINVYFGWHGDWTLDQINLPWDDIEKFQAAKTK